MRRQDQPERQGQGQGEGPGQGGAEGGRDIPHDHTDPGLSLASISYSVRGGRTKRTTVKLSNAAYNLLEKVAGHRWTATVTSAATSARSPARR